MLNVYVDNLHVGELFRGEMSERPEYLFGYTGQCPASHAVSLTMPVVRDQYTSEYVLHPIFEMNLPEGELRDRLQRSFSKVVSNFDALAMLGIVGASQIGRMRFAAPGKPSADMPTQSVEELIAHDGAEGLFEDLLARYATHSGVSGIQPKVLIRDANAPDRITHRGATHIVKAWNPENFPHLAENEFFCMKAAEYAQLPVPKVSLSNEGKFLIVERFDLEKDRYLGFEDFCVLNAYSSGQKYTGSYEQLSKRIREFVSPEQVRPALENFFKTLALSCAVKNGDAHLKNFGVLYESAEEGAAVWLAPTYDIVSTTPYLPKDALALTLGGSKAFPKTKALLAFGRRHCDLTESRVKELLDEVAEGISRAANDLRTHIREHPEFAEIGNRMLAEWENGISRSLRQENGL